MIGNLYDTWNLTRKMTPSRLLNASGVWSRYHYSRLAGKPSHWAMPFSISIEPTTSCNLRCPRMPFGIAIFYQTYRNAEGRSVQEYHRPTTEFIILSDFLLSGWTLSASTVPGTGKLCFNQKNIDGHLHQCPLPEWWDGQAYCSIRIDRLIISIDGTTQESYGTHIRAGEIVAKMEMFINKMRP